MATGWHRENADRNHILEQKGGLPGLFVGTLVTYNVRGLNTAKKRYKLNKELQFLGANVACLQETYVTHMSGGGGLASY